MSLFKRLFGKKHSEDEISETDRIFYEGGGLTWLGRADLKESLGQAVRGEGTVRVPKPQDEAPSDMRVTPVDNPLDYRPDGSIKEGDPAWDFMMEVMDGGSGIAVQREDGTWETSLTKDEPRAD